MNYYYIKYEFLKEGFKKTRFLFIESKYDLSHYFKDFISQIRFIRNNIKENRYNLEDYYISIKDIKIIDEEVFDQNYKYHQNQIISRSFKRNRSLFNDDLFFIEFELEGIFLWY